MSKIIEGFKNEVLDSVGLLKKEIKELSDSRLAICKECEFKNGIRCGVCGCFLKAKSMSPNSNCPKDKWNKVV